MKEALLLLGPSGVGKSPLGDLLEARGLWGRSCLHFDFGAHLRAVAAGAERPAGLADSDVDVVRRALATGALLTDAEFSIAEAVLRDVVEAPGPGAKALVVLNGLPRHVGQARDVEGLLDVGKVIHLRTTVRAVLERILTDVGGDRSGRLDDGPDAVAARLSRFETRTLPLIDHYAGKGARIVTLDVGASTKAADLRRALDGLA